MAVDLNGTNQTFSATSSPTSGVALTIAARFQCDTATGFRSIVNLSNGGGTDFCMLGTDANQLRLVSAVGDVETQVYDPGTFTTGSWNTGVARFASSTSRQVSLNGTINAANTTASDPTSLANTCVGAFSGASGNLWDGKVCDVGIWGVALSDAEVTAYNNGVPCGNIRPTGLLAWWLFLDGTGAAQRGSISLTANNTPVKFDQPRILPFRPRARLISNPAVVTSVSLPRIERGLVRGLNRGLIAA